MIDCGFWRLVTIVPSVDVENAQTRSFCWFTIFWISNFFSSLNTRFGSVPSAISWEIFLNFWTLFPEFLGPGVCSFGEGIVAAFLMCFWEIEGSTLRFLPRRGQSRVFPAFRNFFTISHTIERFISSRFTMSTLLFPLLCSLITAFRSTDIVKLFWGWSLSRYCIAWNLRPVMWPWGPKNSGNPLGDGRLHIAKPCVHRREEIWHPAGG